MAVPVCRCASLPVNEPSGSLSLAALLLQPGAECLRFLIRAEERVLAHDGDQLAARLQQIERVLYMVHILSVLEGRIHDDAVVARFLRIERGEVLRHHLVAFQLQNLRQAAVRLNRGQLRSGFELRGCVRIAPFPALGSSTDIPG